MHEKARGRTVALLLGSAAIITLSVATWQVWPHIVFRWRFEPLGTNAKGLREYRHRQTGIVFVRVPGGTFRMGSPETEENRELDEGPVHEVTLSPFLIAKYEVTQAEWKRVMGSSPSYFKGDDLPVEKVSWEECQAFCKKTGLNLPTEAQWEYSCRAGSDTPVYSGELRILGQNNAPALDSIAWYGGNSGVTYADGVDSSDWPEKQYDHKKAGSHPVGKKTPNTFGLHDMIGNVWEWCEDVYDKDFYAKPEARRKDPLCTSGSGGRGLRGGSWFSFPRNCRSAYRNGLGPSCRNDFLGFRPVFFPLP